LNLLDPFDDLLLDSIPIIGKVNVFVNVLIPITD